MSGVYGESAYEYLRSVSNPENSFVYSYLYRILNRSEAKNEDVAAQGGASSKESDFRSSEEAGHSAKVPTQQTSKGSDELHRIFDLVASSQGNKEVWSDVRSGALQNSIIGRASHIFMSTGKVIQRIEIG